MDHDLHHDQLLSIDPDRTVAESDQAVLAVNSLPANERFIRQSLLGRGGGGSVYRAFDLKLNREVAIKVPLQCIGEERYNERMFRREVLATSRLRHPYVVTLFDFEFSESEAILVYEFIDGETLHAWIAKHPNGVEPREAADVVKKVALALQHAHSQQILHRDIKPSNILLDRKHAEVSASLEPRLADFGVAQLIHDHTRTESGASLVGTIHYIPPEVISSSTDAYSHESDVYSLGTVLYELLTGQRPFQGATVAEVLGKISRGDFSLPRHLKASIPRDLEAICLRAMARDPKHRYITAESFAQDLERFLDYRPVLARHPGAVGVVTRWVRRNPTFSSILALSAVAILAFAVLMITSNRRLAHANAEIIETNQRLSEALKSSQRALFQNEQMTYGAAMRSAAEFIDTGRLRDARNVLKQYAAGSPLEKHQDLDWQYIHGQIHRDSQPIFKASEPVYCLLARGNYIFAAGAESRITKIDIGTLKPTRRWMTNQVEVNGIAIDDETNCIFTSGDDGSIVASDVQTGDEKWRIKVFADQRAYDLVYSQKTKRLYCLGHLSTIAAIDTEKREIAKGWTSPITFGTSFFLLDDRTLLVCSKRGSLFEVDGDSGEVKHSEVIETSADLVSLAIANKHQAVIVSNKSLVVYDPTRHQILQRVPIAETPAAVVYDLVDQSYVVVMKEGGFHRYKENENGTWLVTDRWVNQGERIFQAAILPNSEGIYTTDASGAIVKWQPPLQRHVFLSGEDAGSAMSVDISFASPSPSWPQVAIGCRLGAYIHDFNRRARQPLENKTQEVTAILHRPGKLSLLSSFSYEAILLHHEDSSTGSPWNSRREVIETNSHGGLAVSRDGRWIGGASREYDTIWLKNIEQDLPIVKIDSFATHVLQILPHRDIAYWNDDLAIRYCKLSRPSESFELVRFSQVPEHMAISEDEKLIAFALSNRELRVWDSDTKSLRDDLFPHAEKISSLAFTPSGRSLVTLSVNSTLRCWNVQTGQLTLERKLLPSDPVVQVGSSSFSPDLRYVALRPDDQSVHLFRLHTDGFVPPQRADGLAPSAR